MVKQFTSQTDLIPFEVNGTPFQAAGTLPADSFIELLGAVGELGKLGKKAKDAGETEEEGGSFDIETLRRQKELMAKAVEIALLPDSAERFMAGLSSTEDPVSLDVLQEALVWLMSEYKLSKDADEDEDEDGGADRPTQGTSDSATGSTPTGDSSEDV